MSDARATAAAIATPGSAGAIIAASMTQADPLYMAAGGTAGVVLGIVAKVIDRMWRDHLDRREAREARELRRDELDAAREAREAQTVEHLARLADVIQRLEGHWRIVQAGRDARRDGDDLGGRVRVERPFARPGVGDDTR